MSEQMVLRGGFGQVRETPGVGAVWTSDWLARLAPLLGLGRDQPERDLNRRLSGYPRNANYKVWHRGFVPGSKLLQRWRRVRFLYPEPLDSLLDIGCSRGFYVLEAARRPTCRLAVGIDADPGAIALASEVKDLCGQRKASFHLAGLEDLAADPLSFGGPFQTVLLLNTYHYIFWGSAKKPEALPDHRAIFARLARLCRGRLIFSGPLDLKSCPEPVRRRAGRGSGSGYNRDAFLEAAERFFKVRVLSGLEKSGKRPLLLMERLAA